MGSFTVGRAYFAASGGRRSRRRQPTESHSHFGPLAVDAHLQGQGIGTAILAEYERRLDQSGQVGYLETDRYENVRLYERYGFEVIGEEAVIGVPNWFMRREARK